MGTDSSMHADVLYCVHAKRPPHPEVRSSGWPLSSCGGSVPVRPQYESVLRGMAWGRQGGWQT